MRQTYNVNSKGQNNFKIMLNLKENLLKQSINGNKTINNDMGAINRPKH